MLFLKICKIIVNNGNKLNEYIIFLFQENIENVKSYRNK